MLHRVGLPSKEISDGIDPQILSDRQVILSQGMTAYFERSEQSEMETSQVKSKWGFRDSTLIEKQKIW
jgi:hypothetical protein